MSKILRRPMFRGGPVDSRGTGITSGLMNGGRVGYNMGGGQFKTGAQIVKAQEKKPFLNDLIYNAGMPFPYERTTPLKNIELTDTSVEKEETSKGDVLSKITDYLDVNESNIFEGYENFEDLPKSIQNFTSKTDFNRNKKEEADIKESIKNQEILENKEFFSGNINDVKSKIKDVKEINPNPEIVDPNGNVKTESTEISLDDIRAQADLFKELLGEDREKELKEARISDASDYALKFFEGSQKEGATVGSSAADVAAFATKGPSKTEKAKAGFKKTDQTATVMAINDYLQGKKSAAEIDKIIKMTDYKGNVNLTNQLKLIELKRGNIAERINEATVSKGLPASVSAIKSILREEGKEITTIPKGKEGTWKPSKEDEGNFIIEEETKNVYQIINGASVKLY